MIKVLITGPEASGKSFLSIELAKHYRAAMVPEFARKYLKNKTGYSQSDLTQIALGQQNIEADKESKNPQVLICDTGIEVIHIWSQDKFGSVDPIIREASTQFNYDVVLLCKPNIPWQADALRENPLDRSRLFDLYLEYLNKRNISFYVIDEILEKRTGQSIKIIDSVI